MPLLPSAADWPRLMLVLLEYKKRETMGLKYIIFK